MTCVLTAAMIDSQAEVYRRISLKLAQYIKSGRLRFFVLFVINSSYRQNSFWNFARTAISKIFILTNFVNVKCNHATAIAVLVVNSKGINTNADYAHGRGKQATVYGHGRRRMPQPVGMATTQKTQARRLIISIFRPIAVRY